MRARGPPGVTAARRLWSREDQVRILGAEQISYYYFYEYRRDDQWRPVTEEQIAAWAAEAEAGYDVDALRKRCRGRLAGARPSQVIALRLTSDELAAIDARAAREGSRSEVIREALAASAA